MVRSGKYLGGSTKKTCWDVGCEKWWRRWYLVGFSTWETETYRAIVTQSCHPYISLDALLKNQEDPWKTATLTIYLWITNTIAEVLFSICGMNGTHRSKYKIIWLDRVIAAVLKTTGHVVWCKNKGYNFLATYFIEWYDSHKQIYSPERNQKCLQVRSKYKIQLWIEKIGIFLSEW